MVDTMGMPLRSGIIAEASVTDSHLVPTDERTFYIPSLMKGWPGISSAFYAAESLSTSQIDALLSYVGGSPSNGFYTGPKPTLPETGGEAYNGDPELRKKVEKAAVDFVTAYYRKQGWSVESVEPCNEGWDLEVTKSRRFLAVEVKGRQTEGSVDLTPNEYDAMNNVMIRMSYRIAIVFNALSKSPRLTIFSYSPGLNGWVSDAGDTLGLQPLIGARATF
jgi:hypothetical protein